MRVIFDIAAALGGAFGTAAWAPQVWKTWKTRSADDFSYGLLFLICASLGCLSVTSAGYRQWLLFVGFVIQLSAALAIIVVKYLYRPAKRHTNRGQPHALAR